MREYQVRFCERLRVKFPGPTRHSRQTQLARKRSYDRNSLKADTVFLPSRVAHVRHPQ